MPVLNDFTLAAGEDGTLSVQMVPQTPVGAWTLRYQEINRFGGISGLVTKYCASGFNGVSGITVVNSGNGQISVALFASEVSGRLDGVYSYKIQRLDSGSATTTTEGYRIQTP